MTPAVESAVAWKKCSPMAWAGDRIFYNARKTASTPFEGWSARQDGTAARCITRGAFYPAGSQKGIGDVTPDGRYALATVERADHHPLVPVGTYLAAPGIGTWNDLWLQTTDGTQAWKLVSIDGRADALIWPRFDRQGERVVWAELWKPKRSGGASTSGFGSWRLHVGALTWDGGTPTLTETARRVTDGLVEPYGFTPGGRILFAADALAGTDATNLQIMTLPVSLAGTPKRFSPKAPAPSAAWANYNEFAFVMPGDQRVIFARSVGAFYFSLEYWTAKLDGSDARQLTTFSIPGSKTYDGFLPASLCGPVAFDPRNPKRFVCGIETTYTGDYKSKIVTLA